MNPSTARAIPPAATPRTGRGASAPQTLPFSALPHDLRKDPQLVGNQTAIVLAATLLEYARTKAYCYPTNATLAADMGCCVSTIRNALAALRRAGWVRLELGSNQPNGRRIWLTWRCGPAPTQPSSDLPQVSDTRQPVGPRVQPAGPPIQPVGRPTQPAEPHTQPVGPPDQSVGPENRIVIVEAAEESSEESRVADPALRSRSTTPAAPLGRIAASEAQRRTVPPRAGREAATYAIPFDLRAVGAAPELHPGPPSGTQSTRRRGRLGLGLTLEELARVAGDTADPILAAELARRTGPREEPPPRVIPTAELLALLPGRHDLIMAAARRLCEETGDFNVATQRTCEQMAEAVATRAVPAAVLLSCYKQAMGPKAEHKGKVLVAAWGREAREYVTPIR